MSAAMNRLIWSVRRELWENRSIYIAPLAVAAIFLVGFFVGLVRLPERMRTASALGPMQQQEVLEQPYVIVSLMLMAVALLVAVFYCLDALYGERRDRSILFWKSLPVSDLTTVLAKASIPILVLPLVALAVTMATQLIMHVASSAALAIGGMSPTTVWTRMPILDVTATHFGHLVGFHGIWHAPFYGWLLMVSAWAKRAPFLWATLPPVVIGVVEKLAFDTSHFATLLQHHFMGGPQPAATAATTGDMTMDMLTPYAPWVFVTRPGLWIGLAITAGFLFVAVRLHRSRGPI